MTAEPQPQAKTPQPVRLADYRPPDYLVDQVELHFRLEPAETEVRTRLVMRRNPATGEHVRPLGRDRTLHRDLEAVEELIHTGSLLAAVEAACGPLE